MRGVRADGVRAMVVVVAVVAMNASGLQEGCRDACAIMQARGPSWCRRANVSRPMRTCRCDRKGMVHEDGGGPTMCGWLSVCCVVCAEPSGAETTWSYVDDDGGGGGGG
ncbi:hypothetical protein L1887_49673 [Cichorium endivia]|nr:hypothetical protein L1887_49673 [Cichorium endivia]